MTSVNHEENVEDDRDVKIIIKGIDDKAPENPGEGTIPVCDFITSKDCSWPAWAFFEEKKLDNCPIACESIEYSAKLSYARFPSNPYVDILAKEYGLIGTHQENREFLRDNLLELKIYYEDLTFKDIHQVPSYDLFSLLGDVGGQIGLFLGASLLTLVEYLDLLGMIAYTSYKYRN
ncbi:hypothetical protein QZH41_013515 [Actinostola sp. cb2023]|nr:hypothetical protein QZH41_013515 [Actinostola sp. cb2023]